MGRDTRLSTLGSLLGACLLLGSCALLRHSKIAGTWHMKDFAGWTCEFKANGTYHHAAVTKTGIAMSGDGTYSLDGHTLRMGQPDIRGDSPNSPNQIIMFGMIKRFTPPESTITWTSDDEFTLTHRNELRGENESCTWVRQK